MTLPKISPKKQFKSPIKKQKSKKKVGIFIKPSLETTTVSPVVKVNDSKDDEEPYCITSDDSGDSSDTDDTYSGDSNDSDENERNKKRKKISFSIPSILYQPVVVIIIVRIIVMVHLVVVVIIVMMVRNRRLHLK